MPLLGQIDAVQVQDLLSQPIQVALHVSLKDPVLLLEWQPADCQYELFRGPDSLWSGPLTEEAVAEYHKHAGFLVKADGYADLF